MPDFNFAALEIAADRFSDIPVELDIVEKSQAAISQRLSIIFNSGSAVGLPNIVLIEDYHAPIFLQTFCNFFYEITNYINPNDFAQYKIASTNQDGRQYGVPFDSGVTGLHVRTDILEQAGFTIDDVTNIDWDELIAIAQTVLSETGIPLLTLNVSNLGIIRVMIQTAGSWYADESGNAPFIANNIPLRIAFEIYQQLVAYGLALPVADTLSGFEARNNSDVWAVVTGNWVVPSIMQEESQHGSWAIAPTPRLPGVASVNASNLGGSSWYVLDISGREVAAQFLASSFGSNAEFHEALLFEIGVMGTFIPFLQSEALYTEVGFFGYQTIFRDFADWTLNVPRVNYGLHTYALDSILLDAMQSFLSGADLLEVLDAAQVQAENQLGG